MRPVLLFLILCWHLAGGYKTATASDFHGQRSYTPAQGMEKVRQLSTADNHPDLLATECSSLAEDIAHFISAEDDEEEDGTRRHHSLARDILAFSCASLVYNHYCCPSQSLSLGKDSSRIDTPKYITQSVLRI